MPDSHHQFIPSTGRIESFSDGVIAIIMTLMIFDLKMPPLVEGADSWEILKVLPVLFPKFLSFAMSFFVLAIFWVNHHHLFHTLKHTNRKLLWHNIHLLFWLSIIPFPTALLGSYPLDTLVVMMYGSVMMMAALAFQLLLLSARRGCLFHEYIDPTYLKKVTRKGIWGPLIYGFAVVVAPANCELSLWLFLVAPILYFLPDRILIGDQK